jgi:hypothetical protein
VLRAVLKESVDGRDGGVDLALRQRLHARVLIVESGIIHVFHA